MTYKPDAGTMYSWSARNRRVFLADHDHEYMVPGTVPASGFDDIGYLTQLDPKTVWC